VINNEFAHALDIGTSHELKAGTMDKAALAADIYETKGGCVCCGGGNDLIRIMHDLIHYADKLDHVLLETTGLADPSFANLFELLPTIKQHYYIDGFVTLLDARDAMVQLSKPAEVKNDKGDVIINETVTQLLIADRIILNKIDLVHDKSQLNALEERVRSLNPLATCIRSEYSRVGDLKQILGIKAFDLERVQKTDNGFLEFRPYRRHDPAIDSRCFISKGPIPQERFDAWIKGFLADNKSTILRFKAVLHIKGKSEKYMYQGVKDMLSIEPRQAWGAEEIRVSRYVFIGRHLKDDVIRSSFLSAVRPRPTTDVAKTAAATQNNSADDEIEFLPYGQPTDEYTFRTLFFFFIVAVLIWYFMK